MARLWGKAISKKQKYFLLPDQQVPKNTILVFDTRKEDKGIRANLLLNLWEFKSRLFSHKNVSQIPIKKKE